MLVFGFSISLTGKVTLRLAIPYDVHRYQGKLPAYVYEDIERPPGHRVAGKLTSYKNVDKLRCGEYEIELLESVCLGKPKSCVGNMQTLLWYVIGCWRNGLKPISQGIFRFLEYWQKGRFDESGYLYTNRKRAALLRRHLEAVEEGMRWFSRMRVNPESTVIEEVNPDSFILGANGYYSAHRGISVAFRDTCWRGITPPHVIGALAKAREDTISLARRMVHADERDIVYGMFQDPHEPDHLPFLYQQPTQRGQVGRKRNRTPLEIYGFVDSCKSWEGRQANTPYYATTTLTNAVSTEHKRNCREKRSGVDACSVRPLNHGAREVKDRPP